MEDKEFDELNELYEDILYNGLKDKFYREKFEKLMQLICSNLID